MRDSIQPTRLTRSRRARLLAVGLLLSVVSVAGCTGSSRTTAGGAATARGAATPANLVSGCQGCYAPHLFRVAYGIQPLLDRGIDGRGETVTVLDPAPPLHATATQPPAQGPDVGDIRQDLAAFDSMFRLPAAPIQVVTILAGAGSPWQASAEEAQDIEMVHAVAPAATLRVVLLPVNFLASVATATADMIAGLRLAVSGTDVASISWGLGEHFFTKAQVAQMHSILLGAEAHHVTVVATSGGNGGFSDAWFGGTPVKEVSLPASDPLVLAVGGTTLTVNLSTGAYISETPWNGQAGFSISIGASGGGFSRLYARPGYQDGVPGISAMRGVPDVAGDADQQGGLSIVFAGGGQTSVNPDQGTSASAPLWGGLMALADQYAHHDLGFVNPAIYRIARSSSYHTAFHDVTAGGNVQTLPYPAGTAGYQAGPGWDPATGWGSPDAQVLVPMLARLTQADTVAISGRMGMSSSQAHLAHGTDNAGPPPQVMAAADGICRTFGSGHTAVHALRGVSLTIDRGQLVALRGRSGSGKTTLLNIIGGLDDPTAGRVWVDGREVNRMTERERLALRRDTVAFIFQSFGLVPMLSAAENVGIPLRIEGLRPSERRQRVAAMLALTGMSGHAAHRPDELSGGQQQRVGIARALAGRPGLLIADEPTSQLDLETGRQIMELLLRVVRTEGVTALVATHDEALIDLADKVIVLEDGSVSSTSGG